MVLVNKTMVINEGKSPWRVPCYSRDGKISLLALVFLVFMVVLLGWLGNTGHVVNQKLKMQNASDSIAFSSSMWLARGMNAVTASNHLVGEVAAISVLHEALGGSELRLGLEKNTPENQQVDNLLRSLRVSAPIGRVPNPYVPPPLTEIDRRLLNFLIDRTSPAGNRPLDAFGTLYDARMTLKRELTGWMTAKSIANLAFLVPPPIGYLTAAGGYAVHLTASANIVLIGKEWLMLEAIEVYAKAAAKVEDRIINEQIVPALCEFAAEVAGQSLNEGESRDASVERGLAVEHAFEGAETLSEALSVEGTIFPGEELSLPLEFEPLPNLQGQQGAMPVGWGDDQASALPDLDGVLEGASSDLNSAIRKSLRRISDLNEYLAALEQLRDDVADRLEQVEESQQAYQRELDRIEDLIAEIEQEKQQVENQVQEIISQRDALSDDWQSLATGPSQNLSLEHLPDDMDPNQERVSQWVRAIYPNLDTLRGPVLGLMEQQLPKSQAARHYAKWSNRYALVHAWKFRSGQRLVKSGTASARWEQRAEPQAMLVMVGAFEGEEPRKGQENWTGRSTASQREAEERFTLLAAAHREFKSVFSPSLFAAPNDRGLTTMTQAILYNANPQESPLDVSQRQAKLGWDTLNWSPDAIANEWGAEPARDAAQWPWELWRNLRAKRLVKLNWQPKLIPVTETRLEQAVEESQPELAEVLQFAVDHASLLTH